MKDLEHQSNVFDKDEPLIITKPHTLASSLGFTEEYSGFNENQELYTIPAEARLGVGVITLKFNDVTGVDDALEQSITLGVRLPNTDFSEENVFSVDQTLGQLIMPYEGEGLPIDVLKNGGYRQLYRILREQLAIESDGKRIPQRVTDDEATEKDDLVERYLITGLRKAIDTLYENKFALEKQEVGETKNIDSVIKRFQQEFPGYTNIEFNLKTNETYLYAPGFENGPVDAVLIADKERGFDVKIGQITVEKKKTTKIKGKGSMFTLTPISKDADDWEFRPWEYADEGEAVAFARIVNDGLQIDEAFLQQPASWSNNDQRALSYAEVIAAQMQKTTISDKRLLLPQTGTLASARTFSLTPGDLQRLTIARLENSQNDVVLIHTGETMTKEQALREVEQQTSLGKRIMRSQVVTLESQMALLQTDRYEIVSEALKKQ